MEDNVPNANPVSLQEQFRLARLLLMEYETFHPFLENQMQSYTVACCNIALPSEVKLDVGTKTITYDIRTEKKYKMAGTGKFTKTNNKKISDTKYKKEKEIAKLNLMEWTKELLWGDGTTVRVYVDGSEV